MPPLVLHLNGAPGVGKSTLARRWADEHPGTLLLEPDALRTWVSGWEQDFVATGGPVREVALAMITAWATTGRDLVLPQLIANAAELARFEAAATAGGALFVDVVLTAPPADVVRRFDGRPHDQPWLAAVSRLVAAAPAGHLEEYAERLAALAAHRPDTIVLPTAGLDADAAYRRLVALVE